MPTEIRVDYQLLCQKIRQRLIKAGVDKQRAELEAQIMLESDLLDVPSHGVRMLPNLLNALKAGQVNVAAKQKVVKEFGAMSVIDCNNGTGRFDAAMAMDRAVIQAKSFGVGICLAKNTTHWGRGHAYAARAANQGFIGLCTTNAIPNMAGWGKNNKLLGNNPLAIGVPSMVADEPVVLDMAMSEMSVGKIATAKRENKPLPNNVGFDSYGDVSSDPEEILQGTLAPIGGYKGAGLSVMIELLTAALAGAAFSYQLSVGEQLGIDAGSSKIFIALNVNEFCPKDNFTLSVERLMTHLVGANVHFKFPGQRGWQAKRKNLLEGVPLHQEIVEQLRDIAIYL